MIITSRSDSPLQVVNVDITPHSGPLHFETDVEMSTEDGPSIRTATVPLISNTNPRPSTLSNNNPEADDMEVDYSPRRRPFEQPQFPRLHSSSSNRPEHQAGSSPSTARSPFSSLLSSVAKHRERKFDAANKRIRKDRRPSSRINTSLANVSQNASPYMHMGPDGNPEQKRENMSMEANALYLVIVNDPDEMSIPPDTKTLAAPSTVYRYPMVPVSNGKQIVGGSMHPRTAAASPAKTTFYDPVYGEPRGAPPAYSEMQ